MAKAQPKNPKTAETPAADQAGAQQGTTAQGTNNDQAAADAAAQAEAQAQADAEAAAQAEAQAKADAEAAAAAQAKADAEAAAAAQAQADADAAAQTEAKAAADAAAQGRQYILDAMAIQRAHTLAVAKGPQRDAEGRLEYEVVSPLTSHKRFEIGETVWLSDAEAATLLGHTVRLRVAPVQAEAESQE